MISASDISSRYFTNALRLFPWAAIKTRWPVCRSRDGSACGGVGGSVGGNNTGCNDELLEVVIIVVELLVMDTWVIRVVLSRLYVINKIIKNNSKYVIYKLIISYI